MVREKLVERGLTDREIEDLVRFWIDGVGDEYGMQAEKPWFKGPQESANVIFFMPQSEYDRILPIEITPAPDTLTRVGIFSIDEIPIST